MSVKFGSTPWGSYFLEAINKFYKYEPRINRGKQYANSGRIVKLEIDGSIVKARVRGNYNYDYKVYLKFSEFSQKEKSNIIKIIKDNPLLLGEIINGSLPKSLLEELDKHNIHLFPEDWDTLNRSCDCPDIGDPCKHMAGVYFILAGEIDKDPFLLFKLRGIDLIKTFKLDSRVSIQYPIKISYSDNKEPKPAKEIDIIKLSDFSKFIIGKLSDNPPFMKKNFKKLLEKFYKKSKRQYAQIIIEEKTEKFKQLEKIFKSADVSFVPSRDIKSSYFKVSHNLINNENATELFLRFEKQDNATIKITPLDMCKLFLNFSAPAEENEIFNYLYYLSRVAYILIESGGFIPAVVEDKNQFFCIFKVLNSPLSIRKQLDILRQITPVFIKFDKEERFFDEDSTNRFILASILTEFANRIDFELETGVSVRHEKDVFDAIFKSEPFKTSNFDEKGYAKSIANYFSIFYLLESGIQFSIVIEKSHKDYFLRILADGVDLSKIKDDDKIIEASRLLVNFSDTIPEIRDLISQKRIVLTEKRLEELILTQKEIIRDLGIEIVLPKELKNLLKPKAKIRVSKQNLNFDSFLSLKSLIEFDAKIAIGDKLISKQEFEELVKQGRKLVKFRDSFVVLEPDEIKELFSKLEKANKISKYELLQLSFTDELISDDDTKQFINNIFKFKEFPLPAINANLRRYQIEGFRWGINNLLNGFGIILADDMGLGKTIQTIAILKYLKDNQYLKNQALIIVPTTLLNNWESEVLKFCSDLTYSFYYGQNRAFEKTNLIFTTYQTLRRDIDKIKKRKFSCIVIDEAQNIKNPFAQVTQAVKSVKAKFKIALSGTPVENNLSELWSIFDFILPKYLKSLKAFQNEYAKDIELKRDSLKIEKLKRITRPFMLRRLKTDKSIIKDLPEKIVIDQLITMEEKQAALYQAVVDKTMKDIEINDEVSRNGLIFKLITSLKQICNHPRNYDKKSPIKKELSGKSKTLMTLLDMILQRNEKVLIFTQYTQMGDILKKMIEDEFLIEPLYLKGSQSKARRDSVIDEFNNNKHKPIFILSLKAGGTGLNLTEANNVIHYDLWFNPAVENQATDRVFRIGQKKNVSVYRFITKNTFEEKIDKMIKAKQELSNLTISSGESWIGKLSNEELMEIFNP